MRGAAGNSRPYRDARLGTQFLTNSSIPASAEICRACRRYTEDLGTRTLERAGVVFNGNREHTSQKKASPDILWVDMYITATSCALPKAVAGKLRAAGYRETSRGKSGKESGDHSDIRTTQQVKSAESACNTRPLAYRRQGQDSLQSRHWKAVASLSATKARSLRSIESRQMLSS